MSMRKKKRRWRDEEKDREDESGNFINSVTGLGITSHLAKTNLHQHFVTVVEANESNSWQI